jgi:hypothetical protein
VRQRLGLGFGESFGVDPSRAPGPGFECHHRATGHNGSLGRPHDSLQDVLIALVGGKVGDHLLQLLEACLEQLRVHVMVLPSRPSLVIFLPAHSEQTGAVTPELALLFDDLCRRETEVHRDPCVQACNE